MVYGKVFRAMSLIVPVAFLMCMWQGRYVHSVDANITIKYSLF